MGVQKRTSDFIASRAVRCRHLTYGMEAWVRVRVRARARARVRTRTMVWVWVGARRVSVRGQGQVYGKDRG
jgi:hypothetical protein